MLSASISLLFEVRQLISIGCGLPEDLAKQPQQLRGGNSTDLFAAVLAEGCRQRAPQHIGLLGKHQALRRGCRPPPQPTWDPD